MEKCGTLGEGSFGLDPDASVDTLLNDATEWLRYAHGMTGLLMECMEETEIPDRHRMTRTLGAIITLVTMGVQCTTQAHAKMQWDKI